MPEQQVLIEYRGKLSFEVINQLLKTLKKQMEELGEKVVTYKRILTLMLETLENITKYMDAHPEQSYLDEQFMNTFVLSKFENEFHIAVGNVISAADSEVVQRKIERVNKLTNDELRKLYFEVISNGQFSQEGGAGLGFIEMAKTSNNKIEYSFEKINDNFVYYRIGLKLIN